MKQKWTHGTLAVIIGFLMYALSFSQSYIDMQKNVLAVFLLLIVIFMIGFFFGNAFDEDEKPKKKFKNKEGVEILR